MADGKAERGRPKKVDSLKSRITIRLDKETEDILNKYCDTENVSKAEAIRIAILKLK